MKTSGISTDPRYDAAVAAAGGCAAWLQLSVSRRSLILEQQGFTPASLSAVQEVIRTFCLAGQQAPDIGVYLRNYLLSAGVTCDVWRALSAGDKRALIQRSGLTDGAAIDRAVTATDTACPAPIVVNNDQDALLARLGIDCARWRALTAPEKATRLRIASTMYDDPGARDAAVAKLDGYCPAPPSPGNGSQAPVDPAALLAAMTTDCTGWSHMTVSQREAALARGGVTADAIATTRDAITAYCADNHPTSSAGPTVARAAAVLGVLAAAAWAYLAVTRPAPSRSAAPSG